MKKTITEPIILLEFLKLQFPQTTNNKLRKMLSEGRVKINDSVVFKAKQTLELNDKFELLDRSNKILQTDKPLKELKKSAIEIIYEDDDLLVVEKPAKLLSVATDKLEQNTLHGKCVDYLKQQDSKSWCYIVHRLDKETSGIMLLSKNKQSKDYLQEQFSQRQVYRIYHAMVEGQPLEQSGTVEQHLMEDKHLNIRTVNSKHKDGKLAITHWEVIHQTEEASLIRVMIETGRRHQIRMAMKELGCPIIGDKLHEAESNPFGRICLHATSLEFLHPATDEPVRFESQPPFAKI
ncbi:MAG TPA: RluA family pseudouridine synthase [Candidatus Poseidoniales archaeon]|nr:MAG TPA: RluA family pseudouridine synthase [Candidatus Poseidoniales archaeon]HII58249.1 RluA family pseudouridine synthase [Candidatus Poseidoniaceae archaeon]|tara:strand:+ start:3538 stop:4413 length:876 start_codon:yes stop_codon:yes gene_type:complete